MIIGKLFKRQIYGIVKNKANIHQMLNFSNVLKNKVFLNGFVQARSFARKFSFNPDQEK
jgi:hypothetical protein